MSDFVWKLVSFIVNYKLFKKKNYSDIVQKKVFDRVFMSGDSHCYLFDCLRFS